MTPAPETHEAKASAYVLHMLLQHLETAHPGLTQQLLAGARADQAAVQTQGAIAEPAAQIFQEAIAFLELAHAQNQMASASILTS